MHLGQPSFVSNFLQVNVVSIKVGKVDGGHGVGRERAAWAERFQSQLKNNCDYKQQTRFSKRAILNEDRIASNVKLISNAVFLHFLLKDQG